MSSDQLPSQEKNLLPDWINPPWRSSRASIKSRRRVHVVEPALHLVMQRAYFALERIVQLLDEFIRGHLSKLLSL
jgi:hypothetical protein